MAASSRQRQQTQDHVAMSNALIESAIYNLSLAEHRLILTGIASIRKHQQSFDDHIIVTADQYARFSGISLNAAYTDMAQSVERLWQRQLTIKEPPKDRRGVPIDHETNYPLRIRWITEVSGLKGRGAYYDQNRGRCGIRFHDRLSPFLLDLEEKGFFTKFLLSHVAPMQSKYGPRLYQIIAQWRKVKSDPVVSVEWLRESWGVPDHMRTDNLKRGVINPALNDVNRFTDVHVEPEYIKTGVRITHLKLHVVSRTEFEKKQREQEAKAEKDREKRINEERIAALRIASRRPNSYSSESSNSSLVS